MIILDTSDSHTTLGVISRPCNHLMSIHLSLSLYLSLCQNCFTTTTKHLFYRYYNYNYYYDYDYNKQPT